ncbi:hypothetical protein NA56DRAFT_750542, partial [Hyaloscypha hepaticicola]
MWKPLHLQGKTCREIFKNGFLKAWCLMAEGGTSFLTAAPPSETLTEEAPQPDPPSSVFPYSCNVTGLILPQKSSADSQSQPVQPNRNISWQSINQPHAALSRLISKCEPEIWNVLSDETRTILVSLHAAELARLPVAVHSFHSCTHRIAWTGAFSVLYQKANKLGIPIFWQLAGNSHIY